MLVSTKHGSSVELGFGPPTQDASHQQDYHIFCTDPYRPVFAAVTEWGVDPN